MGCDEGFRRRYTFFDYSSRKERGALWILYFLDGQYLILRTFVAGHSFLEGF